MAIGSALSVGLIGLKAFIIQIQAFVSPGLPYFSIIGLPDTSLSEARERVKSACQASGAKWPETRVTVNLSPASMPKRGSSHDLAIAASVLSASGMIPHDCLNDTVVLGEVNLDGTVLPINGLLPILLHARDQGVCKVIVPHANLDEAALVPDVDAIGIRHVGELIELMGGTANYTIPDMIRDVDANDGAMSVCPPPGDMNEVMGQETAKWALEVAAAGGHHLMMTGPPGTGKNHARLAHSRHYESAQRIGTTGSRIDPLPMRHIAQLWHQRCSAIRSAAPYRIHRILGRRRRGIGSTRRDHAGASGHPIHGRGARILGTHPANLARTIGIRVCGDIPRERHHLLSGTIPTDHGGQSLPLRLRIRQRRALHVQGKRPYQVLQPPVGADPRPHRHSDRSASCGTHQPRHGSFRRIQPRHPPAGHGGKANGTGTFPGIRMGLQCASHRNMASRQHVHKSHRAREPCVGQRTAQPQRGGPSHATRMDAIRPVRQNLSRTGRDDARNLHENEVDMNENTTADTSVNATAIDDETLSRAVLTYCLDSADAMMYALVKGIGSATHTLQLLADSGPGNHESVATAAYKTLDAALINGITRWGRTINARGMASFHGAMVSWQHRLTTLPSTDPEELKTWFTANGTQWIVAPHHPYWPSQLADLTIHTDWAAPLCLWGKGDPQALVSCSEPVGVVGSRGVSEYGRQSAHELAKQAARAGHLIVSGGALGTDAAAHWGAIQAMDEIGTPLAGRTVAVFAGGLNYIGPKSNERLFETIINHSGALISELCPGTVPEARRFLIRNRLIAALSSTLIVAQARARSGALNTAGWANELNRRVFAVPGDVTMPHNTGCNRLIQEGQASIICSLTDIDEFCHAAHRPQSADAADNDDEPSEESTDTSLSQPTNATAAILKAIRTCSAKYGHVSTDGLLAILAESNPGEYSISRISMELGLMELNGLICTQHGNITITDASAT